MVKNKSFAGGMGDLKKLGFHPWVGKIPLEGNWQPTAVSSSGESHGQRRVVEGYDPLGHRVRHN